MASSRQQQSMPYRAGHKYANAGHKPEGSAQLLWRDRQPRLVHSYPGAACGP